MKQNLTLEVSENSYIKEANLTLFNSVPALVTYVDCNLKYLYVNATYEKWFGVSPAAVIGRSIIEIAGKDSFKKIKKHVDTVLSGKLVQFESEIHYPADTRFIHVTYTPEIAENGTVKGYLSLMNDITDQKNAERNLEKKQEKLQEYIKALHESEERLRIALHSAQLGTWDYYPKTGKLAWSDACKAIYDLPAGVEINYKLFSDLIYPEDRSFTHEVIQQALNGERNGDYDIQFRIQRYSDKKVRWIKAKGKAYLDAAKKAERIIGTIKDITDEKLKELALYESEHKYRQLIETLPAAIYTCDADGYITMYNETAAMMWGRKPEIGKDMWCGSWKIYNPLDGSPIPLDQCPMAIALKEKRAVEGEEIIVECPDGNRYHVLPNPKPFFDRSGTFTGAINLLIDITSRKQIESVLADARKTIEKNARDLQLLVETIPQMAWTSQPDGAVIYVNKAWYDFTGAEDLSGWNWEKYIYHEDHQRTYDAWMHSIKSGQRFEMEYRWVRHDGVARWMLGRANPVMNANGEVIVWIGTATDIHDQKMINERKDEFICIASHELKTPLTSLKAYTQLMERSLDEADLQLPKKYVKKTSAYINRLNNLVSDLLNVSKIQAGKLNLAVSEFDFDEFTRENIESIQQINPGHQLIIEGETKVKVKGDKQRLEQVYTNYIMNAMKYSPKANKVLVSIGIKNEFIQVAVKDFGIGIPQENIKHLFNRFYRVESQVTNFQGLGLGLYISAEIIQRHGGKTWAESTVDEGSTFYFSIPYLINGSPVEETSI